MKRKWFVYCMVAALLVQMTGPGQTVKAAADLTAYIMQGELGRAINRTMRSGEERSIVLKVRRSRKIRTTIPMLSKGRNINTILRYTIKKGKRHTRAKR